MASAGASSRPELPLDRCPGEKKAITDKASYGIIKHASKAFVSSGDKSISLVSGVDRAVASDTKVPRFE